MIPIELLYNERYKMVGDMGEETGPFFTIATVRVHPSTDRLTIDVPESGRIHLTQAGWVELVRQVGKGFEEVHQND